MHTHIHSHFSLQVEKAITMAAAVSLQPVDWLRLGLGLVGFSGNRQNCCNRTKMERFVGHFGVKPETLNAIFVDLQTTNIAAAHIGKPNLRYFLMAMYWLKTYAKEVELAAKFGVDESTAQKQNWKYVKAIQALKSTKVCTLLLVKLLIDTHSYS